MRDAGSASLALVGGTLYVRPDAKPVHDGIVLIENGMIAAAGTKDRVHVPAAARLLNCAGQTITAGFWNSHVHFFERKWADAQSIPAPELAIQLQEMFTQYGFTSVFDLSSQWKNTRCIRDRIESSEVNGPRVRSTGEGILPKNAGLPSDEVLNLMGVIKTSLPEVEDAAQAIEVATKLLDEGVDGIKLFASSPSKATISHSVFAAAAHEAHRRGKPVFVHPNTAADIHTAVQGNVDVIGHTTPRSGPWDQTLLTAMRERDVALTPTLTLWKYYLRHDRASVQAQTTATAIGQLRAWIGLGGTVLFGNDLGAVDYDPREEYALMSAAEMRFSDILAALTTAPAERFGVSRQLGRIDEGLKADITILNGDPAADIQALSDVAYTIRDGNIIYRAGSRSLRQSTTSA